MIMAFQFHTKFGILSSFSVTLHVTLQIIFMCVLLVLFCSCYDHILYISRLCTAQYKLSMHVFYVHTLAQCVPVLHTCVLKMWFCMQVICKGCGHSNFLIGVYKNVQTHEVW